MTGVILAKLVPPSFGASLVERPRLVGQLLRAEGARLVLLAAPAGHGKTVLAHQFVRAQAVPFAWYQLDEYDNDPAVFAQYLAAGISGCLPDLGRDLQELLESGAAASRPRVFSAALVNGLAAQAAGGFAIVLDDYHVITEGAVHGLAQDILDNLPSGACLIIASRSKPPLDLARLRISGGMAALNADDLAFNRAEIGELLARSGYGIHDEAIGQLERMTAGWPAALRLLAGIGRTALEGREKDELYAYLAEEMLAKQPERVREFLLSTSVLDVLTPENCDALRGTDDAGEILARLEEQMLVSRLAGRDEAFRYHQLFQDFLRERLGPRGREIRRRAGALARERGEIDRAVAYYLEAGWSAEALAAMTEAGLQALRQGRWQTLARWLMAVPDAETAACPWPALFQAQVEVYRGRFDEAEEWAGRAYTGFAAAGQAAGLAEVELLQARIQRCRGFYQKSLILLESAAGRLHPVETGERFDLPLERALCLIMLGRLREAEEVLTGALAAAEERTASGYTLAHLAEGLGIINYIKGRYGQALRIYRWGARVSPDRTLPGYYMQDIVSAIYKDWGDLERAMTLARHNLARKAAMELAGELPLAYCYLGYVLLEAGELREAEECLRRAEQSDAWEYYLRILNRFFLSWALAWQNRLTEARAVAEEALEAAMEHPGLIVGVGKMMAGVVLAEAGDCQGASGLLIGAEEILAGIGFDIALCNVYKTLAWIRHVQGRETEFQQYSRKFLELAAHRRYVGCFLATTAGMLLPILAHGLAHGIKTAFTQRILARLGGKALPLLAELSKHADPEVRMRVIPPLAEIGGEGARRIVQDLLLDSQATVRETAGNALRRMGAEDVETRPAAEEAGALHLLMLGTCRIFVQGEEITAANWRTVKARDLLIYLAHTSEPVSADRIMEDLWPETDRDKAAASFHSTLYRLRQTLRGFQIENAIAHGGKRYRLLSGRSTTDWERFAALTAKGLAGGDTPAAAAMLEEALDLYRDDYLADLDYAWLIPRREELRRRCFQAGTQLGRYLLNSREYERAAARLAPLLALDPCQEEVHRGLMRAYAGLGDRGALKRQYDSLAAAMAEELGLPPSEETRNLYRSLWLKQ